MRRVDLPDPETDGSTSVERAIASRASRRSFADSPVGIADVSQLLWAAQGITHRRDGIDLRAAPSAGATFPLVAHLALAPAGCSELDAGCYRYEAAAHALEVARDEAVHDDLVQAALEQPVVRDAPAVLALAADFDRTRSQYPEHGERYVHVEVGHAAENVHLVCESRGLASCPVGAFRDADVAAALDLPDALDPLYLIPFGRAGSTGA